MGPIGCIVKRPNGYLWAILIWMRLVNGYVLFVGA